MTRKSEPGRQCQNGLPTRALCSSAASTAVSVVFAAQPAMSRARLLSVVTPRCAPLPRERLPGAGRTLGAVWPFSQGRAMCVRRLSRAGATDGCTARADTSRVWHHWSEGFRLQATTPSCRARASHPSLPADITVLCLS